MQRGQIFVRHGSWHLRYRVNGKQVSQRLAPYSDEYRTLKSVRPIADKILNPINAGRSPDVFQTVQQFIDQSYLPYAKQHKRPSTYKGYNDLYRCHISARVGGVRLHVFRTSDAQRLLDSIAGETQLSHRSLIHIKSFLSGVFSYAKRMGALDGVNPIIGTEVPKGRPSEPTYAYSLDEIEKMLGILKGTARTAVLVAAYTGLALSELKGLQWADITNSQITVSRTIWHNQEGPTKTYARSAAVPLLPLVRKALTEHRKKNPGTTFVFEGPYARPLDLATLGSKTIKHALQDSGVDWHGWHALRRGLATNLHAEGVQDKTIQSLLRHSSLAVTMAHYVKAMPSANVEAMQKLNARRSKQS